MQVSVKEAAALLNVSDETIYKWVKQEEIPSHTMNEQVRFNRAELLVEISQFLKPTDRGQGSVAEKPSRPEASFAREEIAADVVAQWPELVTKLRQEEACPWPELCQTLELKLIEQFALRLQQLATTYQAPALGEYADELERQARQFEIDALPRTLERFAALIDELLSETRSR